MYATFVNDQDCVVNSRLQVPLEGYTHVGVSDFIFRPEHLQMFMTPSDHKMYIKYDLKTDKETVLFLDLANFVARERKVTPYDFFNTDGMNQLFYSRLFYNKISKIPKISLKATRFNEEEEEEILKLDRLFGSAVLSQDEFYDVMYFKETAIPIL